ncbi:hypothetical protein PFISCL1PPCAC_13772, partial [Pristionchus fissidentatus]
SPLLLSLPLLLLLPIITPLPSFPLSPLRAVQRRRLLPDLIKPTFCPTPCEKVFGADSRDSSAELREDSIGPCLCFCPHDRPVYLNALGFCIERPPGTSREECHSAVVFDEFPLDEVPVLAIEGPEGGEKTLNTTLNWSSDFILSANFTPSCHISDVLVDSALHRWDSSSDVNFFLNTTEEGGKPRVIFNGTDEEAMNLSGAVVQLKVACRALSERVARRDDEVHLRPPLMCITFRVEGESVAAPLELFHGENTAQVVVLGTVALVLLLALIASGLAYFVCWRIQKQRLIGNIQLQFIAHLKSANLAQVHGNTMSPLPHHQPGHHRQMSISSSSGSSHGVSNGGVVQKRRLYFSSDFFEPDCLLNPPPMAEQFLCDIRRMIDMARERIKARRFLPRMHPVFEADDEDEQQHDDVPRTARDRAALGVVVCPLDPSSAAPSPAEESPRSAKSTDSGRETLDSSTSSDDSKSEEDEEEEKEQEMQGGEAQEPAIRPKKQRTSAIPVPPSMSTRTSKPTPPAIPPKPTPSMIPRLGAASPKMQSRSLSAPGQLVEDGRPQASAPSFLPGPSQRRHERRKAYAVFPVDPMLNKSLPRRPRRAASTEQ